MNKASDLPDGYVDLWKVDFSLSVSPISIPAEKHDLKSEFSLLQNIVSKDLMAKTRAYDKITQEKFLYMVLTASKIGVNWSDILLSRERPIRRVRSSDLLFLSVLNVTLGITEPLHPKKLLNATTLADFLKRNSSALVL